MARIGGFKFNIGQAVDFVTGEGFGRNYHGVIESRRATPIGNIYTMRVGQRGRFEAIERLIVSAPREEVSN